MCPIHWEGECTACQRSYGGCLILLSFVVVLVSKYLSLSLKEKLQYLLRDCKAYTQSMYTFFYTQAIEELNCLLLHTKTHDKKTNEDTPWHLETQRYQILQQNSIIHMTISLLLTSEGTTSWSAWLWVSPLLTLASRAHRGGFQVRSCDPLL